MPPKVYSCDIDRKRCETTSSLNKEKVIKLALDCNAISSLEEGNGMSRNKLCELIYLKNQGLIGGETKQGGPPQVVPVPKPVENISCAMITDSFCKNTKRAELIRIAVECNAISSEAEAERLKLSKSKICELIKNVKSKGAAPQVAPQVAPKPPVKPPVLKPTPPSPQDSDEDMCFNGKTLEELKSSKTKLSELKQYAEQLGIKNVDTKDRLAEYICSAGKFTICADDGCDNGEYCDVTNNLCVSENVGRSQHEKAKPKYDFFESDDKKFIGKPDLIKQLKARLGGSQVKPPVVKPPKPPVVVQAPPPPPPEVAFEDECYYGKSLENLKTLDIEKLREYAVDLKMNPNITNNRDDLAEYICSSYKLKFCDPDDTNECGQNEFCDITNQLCVPKNVAQNQVSGQNFQILEHDGKKFVGSLEAISALKTKLGIVSPPPVQAPAVAEPDYRQILIDFYNKHNPAKLNMVNAFLKKYKGSENLMFNRLAKTYNVPNPLKALQAPPPSEPIEPAPAQVHRRPQDRYDLSHLAPAPSPIPPPPPLEPSPIPPPPPLEPSPQPAAERVCINDRTRSDLDNLNLSQLKAYAQTLGVVGLKTKKQILDYLCSFDCRDYKCDEGFLCDVGLNKCLNKNLIDLRKASGYVEGDIDGNMVVGSQDDIDRILRSRQPAGSPGVPVLGTSGEGPNLDESDIENILEEIIEGKKPAKLQQLGDIERRILGILGII
jgi:hypothetical protein